MPNVSVSPTSRWRLWVTQRSLGPLLLMWLVLYLALGFVFAALYEVPDCGVTRPGSGCETQFWSLVYFSFTTQSTMGYGDYLPKGYGRLLSVAQGFFGLTLNALVLGVVVFKALKRSNPLISSSYLVYELEMHKFWFRFANVDADQLREVDIHIQFAQFAGVENVQTDYDTQSNDVEVDLKHFNALPKLRLFAIRSKSNQGKTPVPGGDFHSLVLSPVHFSGSPIKYLEMTIRGYFESTGDIFFHSKNYVLKDVRCGRFDDVDNNALQGKI